MGACAYIIIYSIEAQASFVPHSSLRQLGACVRFLILLLTFLFILFSFYLIQHKHRSCLTNACANWGLVLILLSIL